MFSKKTAKFSQREAILLSGLGNYSLKDTFECGQAFRFVRISPDEKGRVNSVGEIYENYVEYMTVIGERLVFVGQTEPDSLIFYGVDDEYLSEVLVPYFGLDRDWDEIGRDIIAHTDSEFLKSAASEASGIRILRQDPWETVFSFIISQNNNIPRIKRIIRSLSASYGKNLAEREGLTACPIECLERCTGEGKLNTDTCLSCGACFSFPTAEAVANAPELMLPSHPGFRYKYLLDAAEKVSSSEIDIERIAEAHSYEYTKTELMKIKGVGEKVASCAALFAFSNLEAFPVDVWMRRAIDEYFGGELDPSTLGEYAGVAQQYIFHYIRNIEN